MGWNDFEENPNAPNSFIFTEMACAKEWGYKWEEWQELTFEEKRRYLYFETLAALKNQYNAEKKKGGEK